MTFYYETTNSDRVLLVARRRMIFAIRWVIFASRRVIFAVFRVGLGDRVNEWGCSQQIWIRSVTGLYPWRPSPLPSTTTSSNVSSSPVLTQKCTWAHVRAVKHSSLLEVSQIFRDISHYRWYYHFLTIIPGAGPQNVIFRCLSVKLKINQRLYGSLRTISADRHLLRILWKLPRSFVDSLSV